MTALMFVLVIASWAVLVFAAKVAIEDLQALLHGADETDFDTSIAQWGYVAERRGPRE